MHRSDKKCRAALAAQSRTTLNGEDVCVIRTISGIKLLWVLGIAATRTPGCVYGLLRPSVCVMKAMLYCAGSHIHCSCYRQECARAPVGDEELGCWDLALAGALTGHSEYGAGGHPDGVQVGDGGPGAHVAADAGGVADLGARKPVQLVDDGMACGRLVGWPAVDRASLTLRHIIRMETLQRTFRH